jgi:DNA-binding NtrC family response regulator
MVRAQDQAGPHMNDTMIEADRTRPSPDPKNEGHQGVAVGTASVKKAPPFALIIEDQEDISRVVATALTSLGVESATYTTAKPAISSLDQRRPGIIFLDVALEQSDAIDVVKGLSEKHYTGIVQLMSGGRLPLLEAIQRIGARYGLVVRPALQKPFRAEDLHQAIISAGLGARP